MQNLSFLLPKYQQALDKLFSEVGYGLHMEDSLLSSFPPVEVSHLGLTRLLNTPETLERGFGRFANSVNGEAEIVMQTDTVRFKKFLLDLLVPIRDQTRAETVKTINATCEKIGNTVDIKTINIWDAYITALEKINMTFGKDGTPIFLIYPPEFYEKLNETVPTVAQLCRVEEIFQRKYEEHLAKKQKRRLS